LQRLTPCSLSFAAAAGYRRHIQFISDSCSEQSFRALGLAWDLSESRFNDEPLRIADIRLPKKMTLL
jgi:hypothetical protein